MKYIERGFPPKPKEIKKVKTDERSGIVTCKNTDEVGEVRKTIDSVTRKKYFTVDRNRRTATNGDGETIDIGGHDWPVEVGQVIDPGSQKPLVADYDLFDVFDPKVIAGEKLPNQGNLVLATKNGKFVDDFTNPEVVQTIEALNTALGSRRIMHGHHGAFDSINNLKPDEQVTAFMSDGKIVTMNKAAVKQFYQRIGRSTLVSVCGLKAATKLRVKSGQFWVVDLFRYSFFLIFLVLSRFAGLAAFGFPGCGFGRF